MLFPRRRSITARIDGKIQELTVVVARGSIHHLRWNGLHFYPWFLTWVSRILKRDRTWQVEVREGFPLLWTADQRLVFECTDLSYSSAIDLADVIESQLRRGVMPET